MEEITKLLDIVKRQEPLGQIMWASAFEEYKQWAFKVGYLERDANIMKQNFDRIPNENKKTGKPSCPPHIRRAKYIARAILDRASAMPLGEDGDDTDNEIVINKPFRANNFGERCSATVF